MSIKTSRKRKTQKEKLEEEKIKQRKLLYFKISTFVIILIGIAVSYLYKTTIENFVNYALNKEPPSTQIDVDGLVFHFVDVGQADAIIIEFPNDEIMIVDAGQDMSNRTKTKENLLNYLSENIKFQKSGGENIIDYFVITHPDFDHIASVDDIFELYKVEKCFRPSMLSKDEDEEIGKGSATYASVIKAVSNEKDCEVLYNSAEILLNVGGVEIEFLSPTPEDLESAEKDVNNYSPIMIFTYGTKKVMLTGDAEKKVEENLLEYYELELSKLDIDVLKLGHHGSDTSSTIEFLNATSPSLAIISVGTDNSYGHPKQATLDRLATIGLSSNKIYQTNLNGNITISLSNNGEISLDCGYVQYTVVEIKWWYIAVAIAGFSFIILFSPVIFLKITKKETKKLK